MWMDLDIRSEVEVTDKCENKNSAGDFLLATTSALSKPPGAYIFTEVIVQNHFLWPHFVAAAKRPTACSTGGRFT